MKKSLAAVLTTFTLLGIIFCGKDYGPELRQLTEIYWRAVFAGDMDSAYGMLSTESQKSSGKEEFIEAMAFNRPLGPEADGLRKAFSREARMSVIGVEVERKKAQVHVMLIIPDLGPVWDQLLQEAPANNGHQWIIDEMTLAIAESRVPTKELRVSMTWIIEDGQWKVVFGQA